MEAATAVRAPERPSSPAREGRPTRLSHIPALDGLRGVAVAGVLAFHAGHLTGGYLGVDLFFVLSGYLITSLLVLEWAASGTLSLSRFWARRARRLLPALLAVLVAVGVASHWFVAPVSRGQLRDEGVATLAYAANWFSIFRGNGYWQQTLLPSWLQHTWSLAIEEQFYLFWPLIVAATLGLWRRNRSRVAPAHPDLRRGVRRLATMAWLAAIGSAVLTILLAFAGVSHERLYLGTDTRAAAILFGAGLACRQYLVRAGSASPVHRRFITGAGLVGAVTLAFAWTRIDGSSQFLYEGGLLLCGLAATLVLLDVTTAGTSPLKRALAIPPLRWLGLISYGLYLWHWPIFQYLHTGRFGLTGWSLVAARVLTSITVAVVSYRFLEIPIRRGALRGRAAAIAVSLSAGVAVLALLAGSIGAIDPVPQTASNEVTRAYSAGPSTAPRVMVVGDSAALSLGLYGLAPMSRRLGIRVMTRGVIGCTIMRDVDVSFSEDIRNCSLRWPQFVHQERPDVVVVLFGGWVGGLPVKVNGKDASPCEAPWQRRWSDRLNAAVTTLSQTGAKVVLLSAPVPPLQVFKGRDPDQFDARQDCSNAVLADVARSRREAELVDVARFVCPTDDSCRTRLDGAVLREDGLHYRDAGARAITRWIVPRVLAAAGLPARRPG